MLRLSRQKKGWDSFYIAYLPKNFVFNKWIKWSTGKLEDANCIWQQVGILVANVVSGIGKSSLFAYIKNT